MAEEVVEEYRSSLADLTFNSKPLINMLTMLADDHVQYAAEIVQVIEAHIQKASSSEKLPALYLLDSIIKNISDSEYPRLFAQNLVSMFCGVFEKVDEKTRQAMWKLRQTWSEIIPNKRLYALDMRVTMIDPAWPITAQPPEEPIASIHVNPKFLIKQEEAEARAKKEQEEQEALMRQQLLAKQQELLKLQQERLELELAEAKARLVSQAKQLESQQPNQLPGLPAKPPKVLTTPKVESPVSSTGGDSPIQIPTIAVQGIVRDPRLTIRDPRLSSGASESPPPPKDPSAKGKSTRSTSSKTSASSSSSGSASGAHASATSATSAKHKSSSGSRTVPSPSKSSATRDREARDSRLRERTAHTKTSAKKITPLKTRPSSDKKDAVEHKKTADRYGLDGHGRRSKAGTSSSASGSSGSRSSPRSSHRRGSRSLSPERDNKTSSRSRSRSPRRSPRGSSMERKEKVRSPADFRDEKRQRSPEVEMGSVKEEVGADTGDEFAAPPTKRSKPEEAPDSALPADFRELFGNEDVDYRRPPSYAKGPSTPSTPGTPSSGRWAAFKAERPEEFPFQQPRLMLDMPSPSGRYQDVDMRSPPLRRMSATSQTSVSPVQPISPEQLNISIPAPLMLEQLDSILTEADAQLRAGRLSHEQHQAILKQLGELQKLQKLKQQLRSQVSPKDPAAPPADDAYPRPLSQPPAPPLDLIRPSPPPQQPQPPHPADRMMAERNNKGMAPHYDDRPPPEQYQRDPAFDDSNNRGPRPPLHMADQRPPLRPPGPDFQDQGLRERPPHPQQNMPPMMRPPLPPHLAGPRSRPPGPRHEGPGRRGGFNNRAAIAHLVGGSYTLPYDTNKYYIPEHDPRWITPMNDGLQHKLYIDDRAYELPLGCPPRHITLNDNRVQISVDTSSRGIKIDGICYYKIGDNPRKVTINGSSHLITYRGPEKKIWIDEQAFEVYTDGAPQPIILGGIEHRIHIDSILNQVVIDDQVVCPFGGPKKQIEIGYEKHEVQFEPPPRKILIDGKLCEMNFKGKYPCVNIEGVDFGIRFDGPPREIMINNKRWTVDIDIPRKARIASERIHIIAFGGPGHEVIINGQWYEVKFNGPEKAIRLGSKLVHIQLVGPPPEVKILGAVVKDPQKVQELVGDAYIDPTIAVLSKPSHQTQQDGPPPKPLDAPRPLDAPHPRLGPNMPPRPLAPRGADRGRPPRMPDMGHGMPPHMRGREGPPRGGFHDGPRGPAPPRPLPPHMEDRGRGSPQYDDGGRDSPDHRNSPSDNFNQMHNMDFDRPQPLHHRPEGGGPPGQFPQHGQRPPYGGPPSRGYRPLPPRMRGGRGPGPRMGPRDEFYQPRGMRGAPRGGMRGPHPNGPPPPHHHEDFNQYRQGPPPQHDQYFGGLPNLSQPPPPSVTSQIDVNDLFTKLISSGIIKKAADEAPPPAIPTATAATTVPSVGPTPAPPATNQQAPPAVTSTKPEGEEKKEAETPKPAVIPKPKELLANVPDLTDFNVDKMKTPNPGVIQRMYGGIQCSSCGVRFITEDMDKYREHLDWHFRQNRRDKDGIKVAKFRQWYYTTNEWIQFEEIGDLEERAHSMYFEKLLQSQALPGSTGALQTPEAPISCPAATGNADDDVCEMCGEQFENFFDEESEEWRLRDAIRVGEKTYHPACYEDVGEGSILETPTPEAPEPSADPITNPLAFLSKLTATAQPTTTTPDDTPTVKTEVVVKTEPTETTPVTDTTTDTKPPPAVEAAAASTTTIDTSIVKSEPVSQVTACIVKTEPLSQITTLGSTS